MTEDVTKALATLSRQQPFERCDFGGDFDIAPWNNEMADAIVLILNSAASVVAELRQLENELAEARTFVRPCVFENGNCQWECGDCGVAVEQTSQTVGSPPYPFPHASGCRPMQIRQPRT